MSCMSFEFKLETFSQMSDELGRGAETASSIAYSAFSFDCGFESGANLELNSLKTVSRSSVLSAEVNSCSYRPQCENGW